MIATVVDQWIGFGLIVFFAGFVISDLSRPRTRAKGRSRVRSGQSPKRLPKRTNGAETSD